MNKSFAVQYCLVSVFNSALVQFSAILHYGISTKLVNLVSECFGLPCHEPC